MIDIINAVTDLAEVWDRLDAFERAIRADQRERDAIKVEAAGMEYAGLREGVIIDRIATAIRSQKGEK